MIGAVTKFRGGARDARALVAHLGKPQPGGSQFVAGPNTGARDIAGVVGEARIMAAARGIADRPFLHIHLSPSTSLDEAALMRAAQVVVDHLGVTDQPWAVEMHGKGRRSGEGEQHAHIVLGRAGASGDLLPSGFEKIKLQTAVRIAEFEVGEPHVRGSHHAASVKHLRKIGRDDVADSLEQQVGHLRAPRGALTAEKRQKLERIGIDGVERKNAIRAAWERSDDGAAFGAALAEQGLDIRAGDKPGVWIVADGDAVIGSVDRLTGEKRRAVAARLRGFEPARRDTQESGHDPDPHRSDREDVRRSQAVPEGDRGVPGGPSRRGRGDGGEPGDRTPRTVGHDVHEPVETARPDRGHDRADRARRSAHVALTLSVAVHRGRERIARLIEMARQTIATVDRPRRRVDLQPSADPDVETDAPAPARLTFHEKLQARRAAALPPPPPPTISDILAEQREQAARPDDDTPVYRGPGYP